MLLHRCVGLSVGVPAVPVIMGSSRVELVPGGESRLRPSVGSFTERVTGVPRAISPLI